MIHLSSVGLKRVPARDNEFPFSVPAIRTLVPADLKGPVTFFVGENGSGKSAPVAYEDLDHVTLTRAFLNDPQRFLSRLKSEA